MSASAKPTREHPGTQDCKTPLYNLYPTSSVHTHALTSHLTPPHTHTAYTTSAHPSAQEITSFLRAVDSAMRESFCAVSCLVLSLSGASSSSSSWDFFSAADSYSPVQTRAQPLQRTSIHMTTTHQWCCVVHTLSTSEVCSSLRRRLLSRRRFRLSRRSSTSAC